MANLPLSNVVHRKLRTGISVFSVALEIASVLVLVGLVYGNIQAAADRIANTGADIIFQGPDSSPFLALNTGVLPLRLGDKIEEVDGVEVVEPVLIARVARFKDTRRPAAVFGIDPVSFGSVGIGIRIVEGRALEAAADLVVDTVTAATDGVRVGDTVTLFNRGACCFDHSRFSELPRHPPGHVYDG